MINPSDSIRPVQVIGAGLAGCEAAWQLAGRGVPVRLSDMKPRQLSPAHELTTLAELVCSNSLRSARMENAVGLLKEEMRRLGSLIIACADATALPAGGALAVDREMFSSLVTSQIDAHPMIERVCEHVDTVPDTGISLVATGPLTDGKLYADIQKKLDVTSLYFFDAAAPIVSADSIDMAVAFRQSRYGRGGDDYINCPMDEAQYQRFWQALTTARTADIHEFDRRHLFEGCMPIEEMAARGRDTIRFGPLKPVGLIDPNTGKEPYACVQLRQDNRAGSLYNIVGFQTRLAFPEQARVFAMIPGLEKAVFLRYGVMHRNTYLPSPRVLAIDYSARAFPNLYFAGQMTGVEGYVESASSGLIAGWQAALQAMGLTISTRRSLLPSDRTVIGALSAYVSDERVDPFQPMNANFGLLAALDQPRKRKDEKIRSLIDRSLQEIDRLTVTDPEHEHLR
ncbi:MAG: methylenetetrahydrofolate--tRNA-(uracil(54)-C(5))-methyltransferase (FADH(2)-oxidizing) TrmFO [Bacillota bacterium]|nr:methylenetetrahydrofolate--tRNA-(uracil(54)-C(5))-methyltransferase (FADH(2)-oxidizing) TrmFO [Bacillota bacterium]